MNDLYSLVREGAGGDQAAFDRLVSQYQNRAVGYAFSLLGDFHLAEDAAQEAFLQVYRDLPSLAEPLAFPGWLRKIVFKYCDRIRRRQHVPCVALAEAPDIADYDADPAAIFHTSEDRARRERQVAAAMQRLSENDRTIITLFYMGENSVEDVGMFLQLSPTAVKKRLQRARERLKERMLKMIEQTLIENVPGVRFTEAAALMRRAATLLENDSRVEAAWLASSFGMKEDDGWSSAWLQVIVKDEAIDSFILGRKEYASQIGDPVLLCDGPQNAPPGGAYIHALYDGEAGPYEINWYWQPSTGADIPTGVSIPSGEYRPVTQIFFDRIGLPRTGTVRHCEYNREIPAVLKEQLGSRTEEQRKLDDAGRSISFFWIMLLISVRWVAGLPNESEPRSLGILFNELTKTQQFLGRPEQLPAGRFYSGTQSKIDMLRETAQLMESMHSEAMARGVEVNELFVSRVFRFIDLVEHNNRQ